MDAPFFAGPGGLGPRPSQSRMLETMRSTPFHRALLAGATWLGWAAAAPADDDLFLPSYQRMGLIPGSAAPAPPPPPVPAAALPTPPGDPAAVAPPVGAGRPRLTVWPHQALSHTHDHPHHQGPHAPAAPAPAPAPVRPRFGRRAPAPAEPAAALAPAPAPAAGPTVAAALSVRADDVPAYVPPSSRGMIARLRKGDPEVPPGLRRGSQPHEMVPPGPLEAGPELADASPRSPGNADEYAASATSAARPALAARPPLPEPSAFAPIRADDRLGRLDREPGGPARRPTRSIPPLIARPVEPEADSPLRRVHASDADLEARATPIGGPAD